MKASPILILMCLLLLLSSACALTSEVQTVRQDQESAKGEGEPKVHPPWELGEMKNPAEPKGEEFLVPEANIVADLHGNPTNAEFVIYSFGHYYFLLGEFVKDFMELYPETQGKVFYQTLPFGVVQGQLEKDYTLTMGNLTITVQPDVFMGGQAALEEIMEDGLLVEPIVPYMTTELGIMVQEGNPKNIQSWSDLTQPGVRLYMPDPERSGTAQRGVEAMRKEGGDELVDEIYEKKLEAGEVTIVKLHHRETPIGLMKDEIDAGLTWATEAIYQEKIGNPITVVIPPEEYNIIGVFSAAMVRDAPHPERARAWLEYLRSPSAQNLIRQYQFGVYQEDGSESSDCGNSGD